MSLRLYTILRTTLAHADPGVVVGDRRAGHRPIGTQVTRFGAASGGHLAVKLPGSPAAMRSPASGQGRSTGATWSLAWQAGGS